MDELSKKIKAKEYAKKYREAHKEDLNRRRMETYWKSLDKVKEYTKSTIKTTKRNLLRQLDSTTRKTLKQGSSIQRTIGTLIKRESL